MKVLTNIASPALQLQKETVSSCREMLRAGATSRECVRTPDDWSVLKEKYLDAIRSALPSVFFESKGPLNARVVSKYEWDDCRVENVLFESLPGWEVNGTVYLPKTPGVYPGVICPTGHSSKVFHNYQRSARTIARNGYVVISFDPPGCCGEKQYMNDHFTNGVTGYLTGFWSMTYFVMDAIRAMDYLETRNDVDSSRGFGMTGVSGGGLTTLFSAILDERITFSAPVCCLSEHEHIHLEDLYTSCPEQFGPGLITAGMDYADYLCLIAPKACLVVAGKKDEVFDYRATGRIVAEAARIYDLTGEKSRLGLFMDEEAGHAYTVNMANEVVRWMNRIIKGTDLPALDIHEEDLKDLEEEMLKCHPSSAVNMFTVNRDEGERLKTARTLPQCPEERKDALRSCVRSCLGISEKGLPGISGVQTQNPQIRWFHEIQKIDLCRDGDIHIPGLLMIRSGGIVKKPALLFIDENGKWEGFRQNGILARAGRFLEEEPCEKEPMILSIDVSGFGELEPEPASYDIAPWNDIERILTYLSMANGRSVMGLRVRDALAALHYLENREDVDAGRIRIGGKGIGAIVALHAALLWGKAAGVVCVDMLSHYGALTEEFPFSWRQSIIIPGILKHYDLPDLVSSLAGSGTMHLFNPLDSMKKELTKGRIEELYQDAIHKEAQILGGMHPEEMEVRFVRSILE